MSHCSLKLALKITFNNKYQITSEKFEINIFPSHCPYLLKRNRHTCKYPVWLEHPVKFEIKFSSPRGPNF